MVLIRHDNQIRIAVATIEYFLHEEAIVYCEHANEMCIDDPLVTEERPEYHDQTIQDEGRILNEDDIRPLLENRHEGACDAV